MQICQHAKFFDTRQISVSTYISNAPEKKLSNALPEKVETVLSEALSARFDVLKAKTAPKNIEPNQFIVTGFLEIGNGYHSRMDFDSALINES